MARKANKTVIGIFVVGAIVLLMIAIVVFGSGELFKRTNKFVLYFDGSVQGLSIGAPVIFRGVGIGTVKDISLIYNEKAGTITLPVIVEIDQSRIKGAPSFRDLEGDKQMIALGLCAKLEVQSFLTGQLMIAFDFYPDHLGKLRGIPNQYPELPTLPTSSDIFDLMNDIPIQAIATNMEAATKGIDKLVNSNDLQGMLQETKEGMRSFSLLTEYLEQHPEALLKGKPGK